MADFPPVSGHGALVYVNSVASPMTFVEIAQLNGTISPSFKRGNTPAPIHNTQAQNYVPSNMIELDPWDLSVNYIVDSASHIALKAAFFANTTLGYMFRGPNSPAPPAAATTGEYICSGQLISYKEDNPVGNSSIRTAMIQLQPSGAFLVDGVVTGD